MTAIRSEKLLPEGRADHDVGQARSRNRYRLIASLTAKCASAEKLEKDLLRRTGQECSFIWCINPGEL